MSENINTGGEFYPAIIGEKSTGDYNSKEDKEGKQYKQQKGV